jgi:hypothetical protein
MSQARGFCLLGLMAQSSRPFRADCDYRHWHCRSGKLRFIALHLDAASPDQTPKT